MKNSLSVSEKFYSIQGEGQTMGIPAVFVRLSGCNLLCKSASWICDSIEVWRKGTKTIFEEVLSEGFVKALEKGAHLVITGGEPLLHQESICQYIEWFQAVHKFKPIIEIETNGTIMPNWMMWQIVDFWNCSPKLANSGEPYDKRVKSMVIRELSNMPNSIFKFVIENDRDWNDMQKDYGNRIKHEQIVLMPAGESQELLSKTRLTVANLCIKHGVRYCDRLHINIWNKKTGV